MVVLSVVSHNCGANLVRQNNIVAPDSVVI
jgi:hypothetical protein